MIKILFSMMVLLTTVAQAQTPNTVIAGPYGVPRLVRNEGGQWSAPIQVFSNAAEIVYVPDITTPGWAQWHAQDLKTRDLYFTYVYTYLRKQRATVQETIYVNIHARHVLVVRFLKPPLEIDLRNAPPSISNTVANITKIVQDSVAHYHGPSLNDVRRGQNALALHNLSVMKEREHQDVPAIQPPRLTNPVSPIYPADAWTQKISGVVTVSVLVDNFGMPTDIQVVKSVYPSLDAAAVQAASQDRFQPATDKIGQPISMRTTIDMRFQAQ